MQTRTHITWDDIGPHYTRLAASTLNHENFTTWLREWSDLEKRLYEQGALLGFERHTDLRDPAKRERVADHAALRSLVQSAALPLIDKALPFLDQEQGARTLARTLRATRDRHAPHNASLEAREGELIARYDDLQDTVTYHLRGERVPYRTLNAAFYGADRAEREDAHRAYLEGEDRVAPHVTDVFLELLALRRHQAQNAGFATYHAYAWQRARRFDYTPEDIRAFRDAVQHAVVPLVKRLQRRKAARLGVETLRPWDTMIAAAHPTPKPNFVNERDLVRKAARVLTRIHPKLGGTFDALARSGLLDLEARDGKTDAAYTDALPDSGRAVVTMKAYPTSRTVHLLLHEAAHAINCSLIPKEELVWAQFPPLEFREFLAHTMELLTLAHLGELYAPSDRPRVAAQHVANALTSVVTHTRLDAFQDWLYHDAPADPTPDDLDRAFLSVQAQFPSGVDWGGLEHHLKTGWQTRHIVARPLYSIEYALAWVMAFRFWERMERDPETAMRDFMAVMRLGYRDGLPAMFERAGLPFVFDAASLTHTMQFVAQRLSALGELRWRSPHQGLSTRCVGPEVNIFGSLFLRRQHVQLERTPSRPPRPTGPHRLAGHARLGSAPGGTGVDGSGVHRVVRARRLSAGPRARRDSRVPPPGRSCRQASAPPRSRAQHQPPRADSCGRRVHPGA